jgi:xylulokinase
VIAGLLRSSLGDDVDVVVADVEQAVATGAAVQAAAVVEGTDHQSVQERWGLGTGTPIDEVVDPGDLRDRYAELRDSAIRG